MTCPLRTVVSATIGPEIVTPDEVNILDGL
jgi:hypothetical protein